MGGIVSFGLDVQPGPGSAVLMPLVNGRPLLERVAAFERRNGFDPAGSYAGIHTNERRDEIWLRDYWTGLNAGRDGDRPACDGRVWVLGCVCGVTGCWPLEAAVSVDASTLNWHSFGEPFRAGWDYTGLGPYWFDREQYLDAVSEAVEQLHRLA